MCQTSTKTQGNASQSHSEVPPCLLGVYYEKKRDIKPIRCGEKKEIFVYSWWKYKTGTVTVDKSMEVLK